MRHRSKSIAQLWRRSLLLAAALLVLSSQAHADGGLVELHQVVRQFAITVFTAPVPLRAGPVDISVLVIARADNRYLMERWLFSFRRKVG